MDRLTPSHINYKSMLKNAFLLRTLHPLGTQMAISPGTGVTGTNKFEDQKETPLLFLSSVNYLCVMGWGGGLRGREDVRTRPPTQSILEFRRQGTWLQNTPYLGSWPTT